MLGLKARIVTGGKEGNELLDMTRPFVFRNMLITLPLKPCVK